MDLENQKVLVAGLGKSGMAAYELLKNMGAKVSLFDGKKDLDVSGYDAPVFLGKTRCHIRIWGRNRCPRNEKNTPGSYCGCSGNAA